MSAIDSYVYILTFCQWTYYWRDAHSWLLLTVLWQIASFSIELVVHEDTMYAFGISLNLHPGHRREINGPHFHVFLGHFHKSIIINSYITFNWILLIRGIDVKSMGPIPFFAGVTFMEPQNWLIQSHSFNFATVFMTYVFNFFPFFQGIDVKSMGRIFIGLVKCGAWGCFDEFNRLEEAVLSAVSMQIQVIQDAIKNRAPNVDLLSRSIDVDPNSGIFITMNPAGRHWHWTNMNISTIFVK